MHVSSDMLERQEQPMRKSTNVSREVYHGALHNMLWGCTSKERAKRPPGQHQLRRLLKPLLTRTQSPLSPLSRALRGVKAIAGRRTTAVR